MEEGSGREEKIRKIPKHKYLGESARSIYERGLQHQETLRNLDNDSHLLKHIADKHQDQAMEDISFGVKVLMYTRSSF